MAIYVEDLYTVKDLKKIIDNAPKNAKVVDIERNGEVDYLYYDEKQGSGEKIRRCANGEVSDIEFGECNIHSISDLKRIFNLLNLLRGGEND